MIKKLYPRIKIACYPKEDFFLSFKVKLSQENLDNRYRTGAMLPPTFIDDIIELVENMGLGTFCLDFEVSDLSAILIKQNDLSPSFYFKSRKFRLVVRLPFLENEISCEDLLLKINVDIFSISKDTDFSKFFSFPKKTFRSIYSLNFVLIKKRIKYFLGSVKKLKNPKYIDEYQHFYTFSLKKIPLGYSITDEHPFPALPAFDMDSFLRQKELRKTEYVPGSFLPLTVPPPIKRKVFRRKRTEEELLHLREERKRKKENQELFLFRQRRAEREFIKNQIKTIRILFHSIKLLPISRFHYKVFFGLEEDEDEKYIDYMLLHSMRSIPHGHFYCSIYDKKKSRKFFNKIVNDTYSNRYPVLTKLALEKKDRFFILLEDYEIYLLKNNLLIMEHSKYPFPDFFDLVRTLGIGNPAIRTIERIRLFRDLYIQHTIIEEEPLPWVPAEGQQLLFLKQKMIAFEKVERIYMLLLQMNPATSYGRIVHTSFLALQEVRSLSFLDRLKFKPKL